MSSNYEPRYLVSLQKGRRKKNLIVGGGGQKVADMSATILPIIGSLRTI